MTSESTTRQSIPFVDLGAQYQSIRANVTRAIDEVMSQSNFILGAQVEEFERAFARFVGVEDAVGVSNGLDALRLSLQVLGVGTGDEVVVPANTFIATALAVSAI